MRYGLMGIALVLAAPALQAARVTNLDSVPHTVQFSQAGTVHEQVVQPDRTISFPARDGIIGLKDGVKPKSSVTSDGLLGGIVGAARTSNIPAGPYDDFTIWKGGELRLQRRVKGMMRN